MKKATRKWIYFATAVLLLFFFSVCLLFLQINSNENVIRSIKTFSNTANAVIIGLEESVGSATSFTQDRAPVVERLPSRFSESSSHTQLWLITNPGGVRVVETQNVASNFVDHLPWGSIVAGNILQNSLSEGTHTDTRLLITFPNVGWVKISHQQVGGSKQYYAQPLNTTYESQIASVTSIPPSTCSDPATHSKHTDFRGGDLQAAQLGTQSNPVHTTNNEECCMQCFRTPCCVYWTRAEGGECWLKGPTVTRIASPWLKVVSGEAPATGCGSTATNNNKDVMSAISVDKYASSATCVAHNATIRGTSICDHPLHSLYEAVSPEKCTMSGVPKLGLNKCRPYSYRPFSPDRNNCGITLPEPVHVLKRAQALSDTPATTLLQPSLTTTDWTTQHPLGSGRFGALVGGNIRSEIIPVSVAGFYVRKAHIEEAPGQTTPDASLFTEAREDLKHNNIKEADKKMSRFIKKNLATFQYLFDMALVYSPVEMVWTEPEKGGNGDAGKGGKSPPARPRHNPLPPSRGALLRTMYDHIDYIIPDSIAGSDSGNTSTNKESNAAAGAKPKVGLVRPPFGDVLVSDGILEMQYGVSYNSFVEHVSTSGTATPVVTKNAKDAIEASSSDTEGSVRLHHREWFASSVDNVMVGTISCKNTATPIAHSNIHTNSNANDTANGGTNAIDSAVDTAACVHAALQLHRDHDLSLMPAVSIQAAPIELDHSILNTWRLHTIFNTKGSDNQLATEIKAYRFDVTLVSTPDVTVPATAISGVVLCTQLINPMLTTNNDTTQAPPMTFTQHSYFPGSDPVLLCNHAHKMHILLSVESNGNIFDSPVPPTPDANAYSAADVSANLLEKAHQNVKKALETGLIALKRDHMQRFNRTMSKVDISLSSTDSSSSSTTTTGSNKDTNSHTEYATSAVNNVQHRIESFDSGCLHSTTTDTTPTTNNHDTNTVTNLNPNTIDAPLLANLFQYGRYLLYSSGRDSMINLQGLWADGPTSAWNGDYHMNINVQMSYWAANAVRVHEAMRPFNHFIQQLHTKGSIVAKDMYGTTDPRGWVAHGFTDGYMDTSLYGDNQWALCVTCGAWAALQQWEHLLYTNNVGNVCSSEQSSGESSKVGEEENLEGLRSVLGTLRGVVLFFKEYMFRIENTDINGSNGSVEKERGSYTMHTGPTTSPENSYILLMTGDTTTHKAQEQVPPAPPHNKRSIVPTRPYEVHSLTFSPSIDISVLRQVANAFTLSVQHAKHTLHKNNNYDQLRHHCQLVGEGKVFEKKIHTLKQDLVEDEMLAVEFTKLIAHMPGGGLPIIDSTLHNPEHQVALHLAKAAQKAQIAAQQAQALILQKNKESSSKSGGNINVAGSVAGPAAGLGAIPGLGAIADISKPNHARLHPPLSPAQTRRLSARFVPPNIELPLPLPDYKLYVREYLHHYPFTQLSKNTQTTTVSSTTNNQPTQSDIPLTSVASEVSTVGAIFSEDVDPGHRHFSGLHWLYPNTFLPYLPEYTTQDSTVAPETKKTTKHNKAHSDIHQKDSSYATLKRAAYNTLRTKTERGGGHTGWSAVWEAALYARLHQPTAALQAITKLVTRYLAPNLMCLHPPLEVLNDVQCSTCFNESPGLFFDRQSKKDLHKRDTIRHIKSEEEGEGEMTPVLTAQELNTLQDATLMPRGMVTAQPFSSKFQIDGNLGYLAALTEMLLQSHTPGLLSLLPALPAALPSGHVYGLNARGNVIVSMIWRERQLQASELRFQSDHFWLHSQIPHEKYRGFYGIRKADSVGDVTMNITAPNLMHVVDSGFIRGGTTNICKANLQLIRAPTATNNGETHTTATGIPNDMEPLQYIMQLRLPKIELPCVIRLCAKSMSKSSSEAGCAGQLRRMQRRDTESIT